jgi:hypothetical protein
MIVLFSYDGDRSTNRLIEMAKTSLYKKQLELRFLLIKT